MPTPLSVALTLWEIGMLSEKNLVAWADIQILSQAQSDPDLLEIAANGADFCLKQCTISSNPFTLNFSRIANHVPSVILPSSRENVSLPITFCVLLARR